MAGDDVRRLRVGDARIGLRGLDEILEEFRAAGRTPGEEVAFDLVERARTKNYIPESAVAEYAKALLAEYRRRLGEDVLEERGGLSIQILGPGCMKCDRLKANVLEALRRLATAADVEHVREPARIADLGVFGTPALVVDGKIRSVGKVPGVDEIVRMIERRQSDA